MSNNLLAIIATSNQDHLKMVDDACSIYNVRFDHAETIHDLMEQVQQSQYAFLIISDLLNQNTYVEQLMHIRSRSVDKYLPIIVLCNDYPDFDIPKIQELKSAPFDFVNLPINPHVLASKIQLFLTLNHQKKALQEEIQKHFLSLAAKKEFFGNINYEIRTPLNSIIGMSELLTESNLQDEQQKYVQTIRKSGELLLAMINTIIEYSKIKSGNIEIVSKPFHPIKIIAKVIGILSGKLQAKHTQLIENIDPNIPEILSGDAFRFEQLLFILLDIGIHQTIHNTITLNIRLHGKQNEKCIIYISIEDTNMELSDSHMNALHENSLSESDSNNHHVGLFVARKFVQELDGNIGFIQSNDDRTELWCTLSFSRTTQNNDLDKTDDDFNVDADDVPVENFECPDLMPADIRVLLVEDNQINLLVTGNVLKKSGFSKITMVENGQEAVEAMKQKDYDLILMDIHMPVMDGFEATRLIRTQKDIRNPKIPIIALTAHTFDQFDDGSSKKGLNDYIIKPFTKAKLLSSIKKIFPKMTIELYQKQGNQKSNSDQQTKQKNNALLLFDKKTLLERLEGDESLYQDLIQGFLSDIPIQISKLEKSLEFGDLKTAERLAHTLKGAFSNVGAQLLQKIATELELFIVNDDSEKIDNQVIVLKKIFQKMKAFV